ncbi:transposable element Tcb2 transposase [Trichonephila clavipes]|nr:transposable element Tcb2 transposase [Trichonephila clavipes]
MFEKVQLLLDSPTVSSEKCVAVDRDNGCKAAVMADKNIFAFVQNENEMNNASLVPTSCEIINIVKKDTVYGSNTYSFERGDGGSITDPYPCDVKKRGRRHGGGRVRSTTPAEDRYIVLSSKRNRRTTAQQVANQFLAASGKQVSRKTFARRLRGGGLYARRPVVCVPLTRQHRTARLQWFREHHNWTEQDWACVLFSDESRFSLSSDCRRQLIWRESGTAYRPENIQEKNRYPTCSIMVWAGLMINGLTRLHVVANGTMTSQRYIDEVLLPHVRLFRGAVGDKFVFMEDNATCHRTLAVQDCLDSEGIQRLVWPARSPDLNPIENVWDALGKQVAGRNYPPTNKNTLIRALTEEWDKLPQQLLDNVVQSMVRRVKCCITLHGGHIPY